jgi:hypothetical protein
MLMERIMPGVNIFQLKISKVIRFDVDGVQFFRIFKMVLLFKRFLHRVQKMCGFKSILVRRYFSNITLIEDANVLDDVIITESLIQERKLNQAFQYITSMNTKERLNNLLQDLQQRFFRTIPGVL